MLRLRAGVVGSRTWAVAGCLWLGSALPALAQTGVAPPPASGKRAGSVVATVKPNFVYTADKGFIDDPLALNPAAGLAAVLRTDSASFARIELVDLAAGKGTVAFDLGDPRQIFERVFFAGEGPSVVVVTRDPGNGRRSAQRFDETGKPAGVIGPVTDFGLTVRGGKRVLIAWDQGGEKNRSVYNLTTYELPTLTKVGKVRSVVVEAGLLKKPDLKINAWTDGYSGLIGQRPGEYDKKRDVRLPDRAAAYDLLASAFAWEAEIADVYGWAAASALRKHSVNRSAFIVVTGDQTGIESLDALGRRTPLSLVMPFEMYDPQTLTEDEDTLGNRLLFGIALDPLNPPAMARQKADKPFLDIYALPLPPVGPSGPPANHAAPELLVRAALDERPVSWTTSGSWLILLRRFKAFARGGSELEAYRLAH